jgi:hypothetical protein
LLDRNLNFTQKDLLSAARKAQISTFGWPIGVVLDVPNSSPKPLADGIKAEVELNKMQMPSDLMNSYDYWTIRNNGDFYLMKSLFEDSGISGWKRDKYIFFDTRMQRVTEILLYCEKLYSYLGVDFATIVKISIKHGGLKDHELSAVRNFVSRGKLECIEPETEKTIQIQLLDIKTNLVRLVKGFTQPLFLLFDFQEFDDSIYEDIVNNFASGKRP